MTSRLIENKVDLTHFLKLPAFAKFPYVLTIEPGKKRSIEQNRLAFDWYRQAAEQLGDESAEDKRAFCKLHFAIPILRFYNEEYRLAYDKYIRPLPYETKLAMMKAPIDYPATRLFKTKQMTEYLDRVYHHFRELGVELTQPEAA